MGAAAGASRKETVMATAYAYTAADELLFVARRALQMLRDPRTNARRLARLLDGLPALSEEVAETAALLYAGRGRIDSTAHAITLIGFDRTERVVRRAVRREYARLAEMGADSNPPPALLPFRYAAI